MFTLTKDATTLTLPSDLLWTNEFDFAGVEQRRSYSVTGALILQSAAKQAGREIVLEGGANFAWAPRSVVETLYAWTLLPGQTFGLVIRGAASINVKFNHEAGALRAVPVQDFSDPAADDFYQITLRFLKV